MKSVVCTLCENDYFEGAGVLLNSLLLNSFKGDFIIGYKGKRGKWTESYLSSSENECIITNNVKLKLIHLDTDMHLSWYKATFLKELITNLYIGDYNYFYFDPDVITKCAWSFFESWVGCGVALCLDCNYPIMPKSHPFKVDYKNILTALDLPVQQINDYYINSGFIGLTAKHTELIEKWENINLYLGKRVINLDKFVIRERTNSIVGDQDSLNVALLACSSELSIIGQDAMDFTPGFIMSHIISNVKPWKKHFISSLVKNGLKPSSAEKMFISIFNRPIKVISSNKLIFKKIDILVANFLSKIIN